MAVSGYRVLVHRKSGSSEHPLQEGEELSFGRDPDCSVSLSDGSVSRRHAVVRLNGGELEFLDLGSRNGSVVDGNPASANVVQKLRPTAVVRIGTAVLVFEPAQASTSKQWCFDRATFEKRVASLLSAPKSSRVLAGLIELRWERTATGTTTADPGPPAHLQQLFARIVGSRGVIGAHESGRLLLFIPDTDAERFEASAGLVTRICDEQNLNVDVQTASSADAKTVDALLARSSQERGGTGVPPVIFKGALSPVEALLSKLDASDAPVLISGETGVGKDVLARALHARSRRSGKPFVALNCAAFTDALFESELFGHERGAFTGASQAKTGLLESAEGGTVFLDEIGEMPLGMQAKMLRVVENREVMRVGALVPKRIDVRFVFATNRDLRSESEAKRFRSDLFFRISSITLAIPPLRERVGEIVPLALHFIATASERIGRPAPRLLPEAQRFLEGHAWTGNVRELKNVMELAVLVHDGDELRPSDIHIERFIPLDARAATAVRAAPKPTDEDNVDVPASVGPSDAPKSERDKILEALEQSVWNQSSAAKLLGMPRRTLVKRLAQYDLPRPRKR